jgi:uncharacterized protein YPO0396
VAKGGGIERLRLPGPAELRIGTGDQRVRLRQWREEFDALEAERRALEPLAQRALKLRQALLPWADPAAASAALDELLSGHERLARRLEARERERRASASPDLLRLGEEARQRQAEAAALDAAVEALSGELAVARSAAGTARAQGEALALQFDRAARDASEAFRQPDVDPARVERQRATLEEQEPRLEARRARCDQRAQAAAHELQKLMPEAWGQLAQYARDHGLALDFAGDDWRPARALLERELARLRDTELANYQAEAERAYATAVETFRSNVVSALADNFARLRQQIGTLNRTLRRSPAFSNNERYQFHVEIDPACRALHAFIQRATEIGPEDTLFGHAGEVPEAFRRILEDGLDPRTAAASPLDDYRRFFHFEVRILQDERVIGTLSERMRSGSGGEHRAPLYVIAGAALAAAYGKSEAHPGGLGLILLDEFGDKIDAQNARAITGYLRSLGLQLVLAAPDTAQGTLSGVLDSYLELFRDNDLLLVERVEVSEGARALLASDQFDLHPALLAEETARVLAARGGDGAAG